MIMHILKYWFSFFNILHINQARLSGTNLIPNKTAKTDVLGYKEQLLHKQEALMVTWVSETTLTSYQKGSYLHIN